MAEKKVSPPLGAYPQPQTPQGGFLPAPPHQAAPQYPAALHQHNVTGAPAYGVALGGGGMYAPYEGLAQQMPALPPLSMYGSPALYAYPGYMPYPVHYYPCYPPTAAAAVQPSIQPLRPTIMIPNGFEAGSRFEGLGQTLLPPAAPGVPPSPAHLAALSQPHQVLWR